jgi:hypothetical protein
MASSAAHHDQKAMARAATAASKPKVRSNAQVEARAFTRVRGASTAGGSRRRACSRNSSPLPAAADAMPSPRGKRRAPVAPAERGIVQKFGRLGNGGPGCESRSCAARRGIPRPDGLSA